MSLSVVTIECAHVSVRIPTGYVYVGVLQFELSGARLIPESRLHVYTHLVYCSYMHSTVLT